MILGWKNALDPDVGLATAESVLYWEPLLPFSNALIPPLGLVARTRLDPNLSTTVHINFTLDSNTEYRVLGLLGINMVGAILNTALTMSALTQEGGEFYFISKPFVGKANYKQIYWVIPPLGIGALYAHLQFRVPPGMQFEIGRIVLYGGDGVWEPPRNYVFGAGFQWLDQSPVLETLGGQEITRAGPRRRRFDFELRNNTRASMLDKIMELDRIAGQSGDVLAMLDPYNRPEDQSIWGRLEVSTPLIETPGRMAKRFIIRERL